MQSLEVGRGRWDGAVLLGVGAREDSLQDLHCAHHLEDNAGQNLEDAKLEYTSAISPPPRKQRPARLVAAAALVAVATVLSVVSCTSSGFNSLQIKVK